MKEVYVWPQLNKLKDAELVRDYCLDPWVREFLETGNLQEVANYAKTSLGFAQPQMHTETEDGKGKSTCVWITFPWAKSTASPQKVKYTSWRDHTPHTVEVGKTTEEQKLENRLLAMTTFCAHCIRGDLTRHATSADHPKFVANFGDIYGDFPFAPTETPSGFSEDDVWTGEGMRESFIEHVCSGQHMRRLCKISPELFSRNYAQKIYYENEAIEERNIKHKQIVSSLNDYETNFPTLAKHYHAERDSTEKQGKKKIQCPTISTKNKPLVKRTDTKEQLATTQQPSTSWRQREGASNGTNNVRSSSILRREGRGGRPVGSGSTRLVKKAIDDALGITGKSVFGSKKIQEEKTSSSLSVKSTVPQNLDDIQKRTPDKSKKTLKTEKTKLRKENTSKPCVGVSEGKKKETIVDYLQKQLDPEGQALDISSALKNSLKTQAWEEGRSFEEDAVDDRNLSKGLEQSRIEKLREDERRTLEGVEPLSSTSSTNLEKEKELDKINSSNTPEDKEQSPLKEVVKEEETGICLALKEIAREDDAIDTAFGQLAFELTTKGNTRSDLRESRLTNTLSLDFVRYVDKWNPMWVQILPHKEARGPRIRFESELCIQLLRQIVKLPLQEGEVEANVPALLTEWSAKGFPWVGNVEQWSKKWCNMQSQQVILGALVPDGHETMMALESIYGPRPLGLKGNDVIRKRSSAYLEFIQDNNLLSTVESVERWRSETAHLPTDPMQVLAIIDEWAQRFWHAKGYLMTKEAWKQEYLNLRAEGEGNEPKNLSPKSKRNRDSQISNTEPLPKKQKEVKTPTTTTNRNEAPRIVPGTIKGNLLSTEELEILRNTGIVTESRLTQLGDVATIQHSSFQHTSFTALLNGGSLHRATSRNRKGAQNSGMGRNQTRGRPLGSKGSGRLLFSNGMGERKGLRYDDQSSGSKNNAGKARPGLSEAAAKILAEPIGSEPTLGLRGQVNELEGLVLQYAPGYAMPPRLQGKGPRNQIGSGKPKGKGKGKGKQKGYYIRKG